MTLPKFVHAAVAFADRSVPHSIKTAIRRIAPGLSDGIYLQLAQRADRAVETVTIQNGPLAKRRFTCALRDDYAYFLGTYEPDLIASLQEALKSGDTVLDVGGNIGYTALVAAHAVGPAGSVVVFEPNPVNREQLLENINLNQDLAGCITVEALAVSDRVGTARFEGESATGHLSTSGIDVATVTLDHYVAAHGLQPAVIKMDIEGGETAALAGAQSLLRDVRPLLLVEVHDETAWNAMMRVGAEAEYRIETYQYGQWRPAGGWQDRERYRGVPL